MSVGEVEANIKVDARNVFKILMFTFDLKLLLEVDCCSSKNVAAVKCHAMR